MLKFDISLFLLLGSILLNARVLSTESSYCVLNTATVCEGHQFLNSSYPYLAIVMASVNGTHITIQLDTKCSFENNNKISNSRMKISYSSDSINLKQLNDKRTSYSLEVVLKQSKNLNSSPSKVNSMECTVNIIFLNHTEFHNYQIKKLNISTLSHKDNYFNISTFNGSKIINSEIDYIVIENEHKYPIEVLYTFRYYPVVPRRSSCLAAIGSAIGLCVLVTLALCWCCIADGKLFKDPEGLNIPSYPYHEPLVIRCCMCCKVPCWQQQIHGFWYYWLQMDQIFWVRWPERTETLNLPQRIVITITFLFFHLIVQMYWNRIFVSNKFIYDLADNLPTFLAFLFVRLVSASTFVMIIGTFYRPFIRCVNAPTPIWGNDPNPVKRIIGQILKYSGAVILIVAVLFTLWGLYEILARFDCHYLWFQVLMPFFGTLVLQTALLATPMRFVTYIAKNTWGHPVILTEQETAKILFKTQSPKRWNEESQRDNYLENQNFHDDFSV